MKTTFRYAVFVSVMLSWLSAYTQQEDGGRRLRTDRKNPLVKTRFGFSPALAFYTSNVHHTANPRQKMALNVSIKEEIRLNKKNNAFLMIGAEYMLHGLSFSSYYFYADSLKLYNGRMTASYNLTIHEVDFPVQIKYSFQKETNAVVSNYIFAGYCYRWIVASKLKVDNNGESVVDQEERLKFKIPTFNAANSSFFNIGFGVQRNRLLKHSAIFAEIQARYALSPFYFNESFAPTSLFMNGHFLYLTVGFKI